jgi:malonyl-CoA O-methyltransferase
MRLPGRVRAAVGRTLGVLEGAVRRRQALAPPTRALQWLRNHEAAGGGMVVRADGETAYPEVTGYLVPTLLTFGDTELARRFLRWLICIQRADGSFPSPDGEPHVFDTAQVLRGLLAGLGIEPRAEEAAARAAEYLHGQLAAGGGEDFRPRYRGAIPETVHLYALPPLFEAGAVFGQPAWQQAATRATAFYVHRVESLAPDRLTHFLGYELDALIDLGRAEAARPVLEKLERRQAADGGVPGEGGATWVCSPGLAQLAVCWYKLGRPEPADRAVAWLDRHQQPSGGFLGSYGAGSAYFPNSEVAWAVKFYLDAHRLRLRSFMDRAVSVLPTTLSADDGRLAAILAVVRPGDRVLEVGCGKGRVLDALRRQAHGVRCLGVDIARPLLAEVPAGIARAQGALETLPCRDASVDVVFAMEAVEHCANPDVAIAEMVRVVRPGGWVVVVDKQQRYRRRLRAEPWESWPGRRALETALQRHCADVTSVAVGRDGRRPDSLMLAGRGRKRARLSGEEWQTVLVMPAEEEAVVDAVRGNRRSPWAQEILLATRPGERVLEIGAGTAEISLGLALAGRRVTIFDVSRPSLLFALACARRLGVSIQAVCADAAAPLPFRDKAWDCVWSSGLLEHFSEAERRGMLGEWARVAAGRVVSIVPNAAAIAYRLGKAAQESAGTWPYGLEIPLHSLRDDYAAAGLRVTAEYSVAARHALRFLRGPDRLRRSLAACLCSLSEAELEAWNQGYLLVTVGVPDGARRC